MPRAPGTRVGAWPRSWEPTSTARRRTASSASSATQRVTRSATSTCRRRCAERSATRTSPATRRRCCRRTRRRTPRSPTPRSTGSTRPRTTRWRSGGGCSRPVRQRARPGAGRAVRLGPARQPLVRTPWRRPPHLRGHRGPRGDPRALRRPGAGAAQLHRLGVQGVPQGRVHDASRDRRPDPGDVPDREVAAHPSTRRRLERLVHRRPQDAALHLRRPTPERCRRPST